MTISAVVEDEDVQSDSTKEIEDKLMQQIRYLDKLTRMGHARVISEQAVSALRPILASFSTKSEHRVGFIVE